MSCLIPPSSLQPFSTALQSPVVSAHEKASASSEKDSKKPSWRDRLFDPMGSRAESEIITLYKMQARQYAKMEGPLKNLKGASDKRNSALNDQALYDTDLTAYKETVLQAQNSIRNSIQQIMDIATEIQRKTDSTEQNRHWFLSNCDKSGSLIGNTAWEIHWRADKLRKQWELDLAKDAQAIECFENCKKIHPHPQWNVMLVTSHLSTLQWAEAKKQLIDVPSDIEKQMKTKIAASQYEVCSLLGDCVALTINRFASKYQDTGLLQWTNSVLQCTSHPLAIRFWGPRLTSYPTELFAGFSKSQHILNTTIQGISLINLTISTFRPRICTNIETRKAIQNYIVTPLSTANNVAVISSNIVALKCTIFAATSTISSCVALGEQFIPSSYFSSNPRIQACSQIAFSIIGFSNATKGMVSHENAIMATTRRLGTNFAALPYIWDLREEFRHIEYHIQDAGLLEL